MTTTPCAPFAVISIEPLMETAICAVLMQTNIFGLDGNGSPSVGAQRSIPTRMSLTEK